MSDAVIVAIITGLCAVFGQWLISRRQNKDREVAEAVRDAKLDVRLAGVEKRLDEHNSYAARFAELSKDIAVIKNDIKNIYKGGISHG